MSAVGDQMKKAADFRCECGFTYSRPFPNTTTGSDTDHYRVMSCGPIWEETLRQLYLSGKYTAGDGAETRSQAQHDYEQSQTDQAGSTDFR